MTLAFAEDAPRETADGQFLLDLDGFDGPIDLLLQLARDKKIDLTQVSMLALAEQYIAFIERARHLRLELAADYLVMAAWLAFLKSRLLLPVQEDEFEPSAEEMAAALAFQLQRLEAMQIAGRRLMALPRRGSAVLARGRPETFAPTGTMPVDLSLFQLLQAYGDSRRKAQPPRAYRIAPLNLDSVEMALERLSSVLGRLPDWTALSRFLPSHYGESPLKTRAHVAAAFGASLELVKRGAIELRQDTAFGNIYVKGREV
jgi:segregation and condensation protein A